MLAFRLVSQLCQGAGVPRLENVRHAIARLKMPRGALRGRGMQTGVGVLALLVGLAVWHGCTQQRPVGQGLETIRADGRIVVLTRNAPTTYYEGPDGATGFEYALTQHLGEQLGVDVDYVVLDSVADILDAIVNGRGHIAAAGLTATPERRKEFRFGPTYQTVRQVLVCRRGGTVPRNLGELPGVGIEVVAGSSYEERLRELAREERGLVWTARDAGTEALMARVWHRQTDCTVADSPIFNMNRRFYPELVRAFYLSEGQDIAWIVAPGSEDLAEHLDGWFKGLQKRGALQRIKARHFGFFPKFDYVDVRKFRKRIDERLPNYRPTLRAAAAEHDLPWRLVAALAYQESHWNPKAKSRTGVRGFMMLTKETAKRVGVTDRLDAKQSIYGGARYLAELRDRVPDGVPEPDRLWFALAAYNMGFGHLLDARRLAERQGLDKNSWEDVESVIPLLARKKYYKTVPHGYARGFEAVRFVQMVRAYLHDLEGMS